MLDGNGEPEPELMDDVEEERRDGKDMEDSGGEVEEID